jgi:hypothetical protein
MIASKDSGYTWLTVLIIPMVIFIFAGAHFERKKYIIDINRITGMQQFGTE